MTSGKCGLQLATHGLQEVIVRRDNMLEKILEEIGMLIEKHKNNAFVLVEREPLSQCYTETDIEQTKVEELTVVRNIIRKHMNDDKCGECNRRKWYQKGYEDGKKDNDRWIPCEERMPEEPYDVLVSMHNIGWATIGRYFGSGKWEVYNWIAEGDRNDVRAWQPLPETYRPEKEIEAERTQNADWKETMLQKFNKVR